MNGIPVLLALISVLAAVGFFLSSRAAKVALAARVAEDERLRAELEATRKALQESKAEARERREEARSLSLGDLLGVFRDLSPLYKLLANAS